MKTNSKHDFPANPPAETVRGPLWLETAFQDLRFALRTLRKSPAFAATAILTLALGIGANTAIFQLLDAVRLRNLPVTNPGELTLVHLANLPGRRGNQE